MHVIKARNVNHAWEQAVPLIHQIGERSGSRAGDVLVAPCPVMTVYERPCERVLFDEYRDANPWFHLFECLHMLSGSHDPKFLDLFVKDFGSRFAEPATGMLYGAYGKRWRAHFARDQLGVAVRRLRADPDDRRTVIAMWDTDMDLWDPEDLVEGEHEPRDIPCNSHIYLRVRRETAVNGDYTGAPFVLDLTVCCRSNDIVWGAYGANAVHFSFLQEYLAGRIGVGVGRMYQMSNNWHAYASVLEKYSGHAILNRDLYSVDSGVRTTPIGTDWEAWDTDLALFMAMPDGEHPYVNRWFYHVARPMWFAHLYWREKRPMDALEMVESVAANDWHQAARAWLVRRVERMEAT